MNIGIMGGTFNPIHNGHIALALRALYDYNLDEIWFLPNGNPPHKNNIGDAKNLNHRIEMIKMATSFNKAFKLCLFEAKNKNVSYSYATMEYFHKTYPDNDFYFIVGADSLFSLKNWRYPSRLLDVCIILAACRDEIDNNKVVNGINTINKTFGGDIRLLKMPPIRISSRMIRKEINNGNFKKIKDFVPDCVYNYIIDNKLYLKN